MRRVVVRNASQAVALALAAFSAWPAAAQSGGPYGAPTYPGAPPVPPWVFNNQAPPMDLSWGFRLQEEAARQSEANARAVYEYCLRNPCRADPQAMSRSIQDYNQAAQNYIRGMQQNSAKNFDAMERYEQSLLRHCTWYQNEWGQWICVPNY